MLMMASFMSQGNKYYVEVVRAELESHAESSSGLEGGPVRQRRWGSSPSHLPGRLGDQVLWPMVCKWANNGPLFSPYKEAQLWPNIYF